MNRYLLVAATILGYALSPARAEDNPEIQQSFQEPVSVERANPQDASGGGDSWADARTTFKEAEPQPQAPEPVNPADDPREFMREPEKPAAPKPPAVSVSRVYGTQKTPPALKPHEGAKFKQSFHLDGRKGKARKTFSQGKPWSAEPVENPYTTGFSSGTTRQWTGASPTDFGFKTESKPPASATKSSPN